MFDFLAKKLSSLFNGLRGNALAADQITTLLTKVSDALLEADVPYTVVTPFISELQKSFTGVKKDPRLKPAEQVMKVVYDTMVSFLGAQPYRLTIQYPATIMAIGLQGSGKTTTIGKLAHLFRTESKNKKKRSILCASVDFYRPAALDQLEIVASHAGASFYRAHATDPVAATQEIITYTKKQKFDLLLLDTAGRLHVDTTMLQELKEIAAIAKPQHSLLVLDAMTGQESLAVAQAFDKAIGFEAAILTKMDSDTRGGAAFAFRHVLKKPIAYVATGEKVDALAPFHPDRAAGKMLGQGDLQTFAERANTLIRHDEQQKAFKAMSSGQFSLTDFADQMDMMSRLGPLSSLVKFLPGASNTVSDTALEKGELEMRRFRAIINSMTPKERITPALINDSRTKRIATGAGVLKTDVALLIERFQQVQQYAKLFKKSGLLKGLFK